MHGQFSTAADLRYKSNSAKELTDCQTIKPRGKNLNIRQNRTLESLKNVATVYHVLGLTWATIALPQYVFAGFFELKDFKQLNFSTKILNKANDSYTILILEYENYCRCKYSGTSI